MDEQQTEVEEVVAPPRPPGAVSIEQAEKDLAAGSTTDPPKGEEKVENPPAEEAEVSPKAAETKPDEQTSGATSEEEKAESADLSEESDQKEQEAKTEEGTKEKPLSEESRRVQRRIGKVVKEARQAEAEVIKERELRLAAEAELSKQPPEKEAEEEQPALLTKPKEDDFLDAEDPTSEYLDARDAYNRQQWTLEAQEEEAKTEAKTFRDTQEETWAENREEFRAEHKDFDEVIKTNRYRVTPAMEQAFMQSGAVSVFYHLAKNPAEAAKIAKMNPVQATMRIGELAATLNSNGKGPAPTEKKTDTKLKPDAEISDAPAPSEALGSDNRVEKPIEEMTLSEYEVSPLVKNEKDRSRY